MKTKSVFAVRLLVLALLLVSAASANTVFSVSNATVGNANSQKGRLSRNGIPSDWSAPKPFPGVINPNTTYNYTTFTFTIGYAQFIEVTIDDLTNNAQIFASAYLGSYNPNPLAANRGLNVNYLGDAGASGNFFGTDPRTFQFIAPIGSTIVLVVNTSAASGINAPFNLFAVSYLDSEFTPTPEPGSIVLLGSGLLGLAGVARRKLADARC